MMTLAPLPDWRDFFLIGKPVPANELVKKWLREGDTGGWLSRSAWSLALIAEWKKKQLDSERQVIVWVPDFFCNEPLIPLRGTDVKLVFYRVTEQFEPDYPSCRTLVQIYPPDIFIMVHYFGKPAATALAKEFCIRNVCWLIEDAAHVLRPVSGVGELGDFVLYSPHKLLAAYDGAILVVRKKGPSALTDEFIASLGEPGSWHTTLSRVFRDKLLIDKRSTLFLLWYIKRFVQKIGINRFTSQSFLQNDTGEKLVRLINPKITGSSLQIIKNNISRIMPIGMHRKRNQKVWEYFFNTGTEVSADVVFNNETDKNDKWVPYLAVFKGSPAGVADVFTALTDNKIYVTSWPDLPPEVINDRDNHEIAWTLRHSRIYLPVHQTIRGKEFRSILAKCHRQPVASMDGKLSVEWDAAPRQAWHEWLTIIGKSNLLQSWAYGEAKKNAEGWKVKRAVFRYSGNPVAMVQVLEKRIAGILKLRRINRGPLFFPSASVDERMSVLDNLLRYGNWLEGKVQTIAPELSLNGPNLATLICNGVFSPHPRSWTSIWLNIEPELSHIRAKLTGKWRSKLVVSEKNNMKVEISSSEEIMRWMIQRYEENMYLKDFEGIRLPLLKELYRNSADDSLLIICRAEIDDKYIAGICVACHGNAATYLVGWSGADGRSLKANHFLLWNAIQYLREKQIRWLDLGGIDEEATPGITEFKFGLGGEVYELVGEGWKFN